MTAEDDYISPAVVRLRMAEAVALRAEAEQIRKVAERKLAEAEIAFGQMKRASDRGYQPRLLAW